MYSFVFANVIIIVIFIKTTSLATCSDYYRREDKLVLNPIELMDLIIEEQNQLKKVTPTTKGEGLDLDVKPVNNLLNIPETDTSPAEEFKDDESLKTRKVWSRWSKWGECSVTCGSGTITRRRMCVAGHCAPGEREEQQRPCARPPCAIKSDASQDEHYNME